MGKKSMNFKESKEECVGGFGRKKKEGENGLIIL